MQSVWGMGSKVLSRHELLVSVFPPCKTVQQGHGAQIHTCALRPEECTSLRQARVSAQVGWKGALV